MKKRTLALVLASAITVVGAFGADYYKNSLMSLKFDSSASGSVNLTLLTKSEYESNYTVTKKDSTTYVITLPETNSEAPSAPSLSAGITSVNISTMPYSTNGSGYTKITVKTQPNIAINVKTAVYLPSSSSNNTNYIDSYSQMREEQERQLAEARMRELEMQKMQLQQQLINNSQNTIQSATGVNQTKPEDIKKSMQQFQPTNHPVKTSSKPQQTSAVKPVQQKQNTQVQQNKQTTAQNNTQSVSQKPNVKTSSSETSKKTVQPEPEKSKISTPELINGIFGLLFALFAIGYFYFKAKGKMETILGEQINLNLDEDESKKTEKNKTSKQKKINVTIRNLDKKYSKPISMPVKNNIKKTETVVEEVAEVEVEQEVENVVDLDELLSQQNNSDESEIIVEEEYENSALEDFLSDFNFDEEDEIEENPTGIDEDLYNRFINDEEMTFTKDDIDKIQALLRNEISDDTIRNSNYMTSEKKEKRPSPLRILENFVTGYMIQQNIHFTKEDVEALNKLINVEIDNDFLTDLRTNPERMREMQEEIAKRKSKPHKTSELLTLNVKDMLPDLSKALKKQGNRRIEFEAKPEVIYASEGYEVNTLKLDNDLPDLEKEIHNKNAYKSRPSDEIAYVDTSYEVETISIGNDLPDLKKALANPNKYNKPDKAPKADAKALLNSISNVTFKPFYEEEGAENTEENTPSVSDIQNEFENINDNFQIVAEEDDSAAEPNDNDDFAELFSNNYVDLDNPKEEENNTPDETNIEKPKPATPKRIKIENNRAVELIKSIEEKKAAKKSENIKPESIQTNTPKKEVSDDVSQTSHPEFCILDGQQYTIINASYINKNKGYYLTKDDKNYCVVGFVGGRVIQLKSYDSLSSENLQARISETFEDGTERQIIKIGRNKFIVDVQKDNMNFVMDLC